MKHPTVKELLERINPGYSSIMYCAGSLKGINKYMDVEVEVYWAETFSVVFAYKDKTGRLRVFTAANTAPLCSAGRSNTAKYQKTSLAQIRTDMGLDFLEEKTGKIYPDLRELCVAKEGEFLGIVEFKSSVPIINCDWKTRDYTYVGNGPMSIDSILTIYRRKEVLRVKHQYAREVSEHNRVWKGLRLSLGRREKKHISYAHSKISETLYTHYETTTTLSDDTYQELLALQVMETL